MIALGDVTQVLEHRARLHQLDPLKNPLDVHLPRWRQFLFDARAFYADDPGWAMLATDLGWEWWELIGCDSAKPFARVDRAGLVWLLSGARIEEISEESAALLYPATKSVQTYRRKRRNTIDMRGLVAPWDLIAPGAP